MQQHSWVHFDDDDEEFLYLEFTPEYKVEFIASPQKLKCTGMERDKKKGNFFGSFNCFLEEKSCGYETTQKYINRKKMKSNSNWAHRKFQKTKVKIDWREKEIFFCLK